MQFKGFNLEDTPTPPSVPAIFIEEPKKPQKSSSTKLQSCSLSGNATCNRPFKPIRPRQSPNPSHPLSPTSCRELSIQSPPTTAPDSLHTPSVPLLDSVIQDINERKHIFTFSAAPEPILSAPEDQAGRHRRSRSLGTKEMTNELNCQRLVVGFCGSESALPQSPAPSKPPTSRQRAPSSLGPRH